MTESIWLTMFPYCSISWGVSVFEREVLLRIHNEEIILFCLLIEPKYLSTLISAQKCLKWSTAVHSRVHSPLWIQNRIDLSLKFHKGSRSSYGFLAKQTHPSKRNLISTACWVVLLINSPLHKWYGSSNLFCKSLSVPFWAHFVISQGPVLTLYLLWNIDILVWYTQCHKEQREPDCFPPMPLQ